MIGLGEAPAGHERRRASPWRWLWFWLPIVLVAGVYLTTSLTPPPSAVGNRGAPRDGASARWLKDDSWINTQQERQLEQAIFDQVFSMIAAAESVILLDLFLFNDWQGPTREGHRALADELTSALVERRKAVPELAVVFITDPINTVYGGLASPHLQKLRAAGIEVVLTDLTTIQDSNPLYSSLWRWLIRPFGNAKGGALPNPFGAGAVSLRSYLALLNFKANHRKLLIADDGNGSLHALVSSANPHDGSSAHRNTALHFGGLAAADLLHSEYRLLAMMGATNALDAWPVHWRNTAANGPNSRADTALAAPTAGVPGTSGTPTATLRVLTESAIKRAALGLMGRAGAGDKIDLSMFYLADRDIVGALIEAHRRNVRVRVLLDVNSDAFGRQKNGVPNKAVAAELFRHGVPVRWCATQGEQCHAKQLQVTLGKRRHLQLGSGNFTRRNLDDFNLETDVLLVSDDGHPAIAAAAMHFDRQWNNTLQRHYSSNYEAHADESLWLQLQYRFMEASGLSTF